MNLEHLKQVLKQITDHPETWDQKEWHCGTKHCIAGWAQILGGFSANNATVRRDARQYLELTRTEANVLFSPDASLQDLENACNGKFYNRDGYDRDGYDRDGYNRDGYDRDGYDRKGYDRCGYDRDGLNSTFQVKRVS